MKTINLIKRMSKEINLHPDCIINNIAYWRKYQNVVISFFKQKGIKEISVNNYTILTGLKKEYSLELLIQLNKELFIK